MPPHSMPPQPKRARPALVWAVLPGLLLGFYAGIELSRGGRAAHPTIEPGVAPTLASVPHSPSGDAAAGPPPAQIGPTRQSERARIEGTDPASWLARFGDVEAAPLEEDR